MGIVNFSRISPYSIRHLRKMVKDTFIGKKLDPVKGKKLFKILLDE